jgi:hypothetical protein
MWQTSSTTRRLVPLPGDIRFRAELEFLANLEGAGSGCGVGRDGAGVVANALGLVVVCADGACSSGALPEHFAQEASCRGY